MGTPERHEFESRAAAASLRLYLLSDSLDEWLFNRGYR